MDERGSPTLPIIQELTEKIRYSLSTDDETDQIGRRHHEHVEYRTQCTGVPVPRRFTILSENSEPNLLGEYHE